MADFGWSYPPGCSGTPYDEEHPIDLRPELEAMGKRGHGLCGKDADLDYGGQIKVLEAWWFESGSIEASLSVYASIVPNEQGDNETDEDYEAYTNVCQECVCGVGYSGYWDGDYWVMSLEEPYTLEIQHDWDDDKTDEENVSSAVSEIYEAIFKDPAIVQFQAEMTYLSKAMEREIEPCTD